MTIRSDSNKSMLLVFPVDIIKPRAGNEFRCRNLVDQLQNKGIDLYIVLYNLDRDQFAENQFEVLKKFSSCAMVINRFGVEMYNTFPQAKKSYYARFITRRIKLRLLLLAMTFGIRQASLVKWYIQSGICEVLEEMYSVVKPDAVLTAYATTSFVFDYFPEAIKVIDTHDVFSRKNTYHKRQYNDYSAMSLRFERRLLSSANLVIGIQEEESELLREIAKQIEVVCLPPLIQNSAKLPMPNEFTLGFIASGNSYNQHALSWFLREVFPKILKEKPDVTLIIAGSICNFYEECRLQNVIILGEVDDLRVFYSKIVVAINPGRDGTGLKIKSLEALEFGRYLVAFSNALEGITGRKKEQAWELERDATPEQWVKTIFEIQKRFLIHKDSFDSPWQKNRIQQIDYFISRMWDHLES